MCRVGNVDPVSRIEKLYFLSKFRASGFIEAENSVHISRCSVKVKYIECVWVRWSSVSSSTVTVCMCHLKYLASLSVAKSHHELGLLIWQEPALGHHLQSAANDLRDLRVPNSNAALSPLQSVVYKSVSTKEVV